MVLDVIVVILPGILSFIVGILITPIIADFLYKNKMWKTKAGKIDLLGSEASVFNKLHEKREVSVPRMGGTIIWISVCIVTAIIWILAEASSNPFLIKLDFISRNQTWIPFFALILGALVGLVDDFLEINGSKEGKNGGLSSKKRLIVVGLIGILVSSWFYFKLDVSFINLPFGFALDLGWMIIPIFTLIIMFIYSGGVIDGIDGLAGGVFTIIFSSYAVIAFSLSQFDLAAFNTLVAGATLAFLWFNIPPARFYMSETGSMALTITLAVSALMTDALGNGLGIFLLPIIAFPLIITVLSVIVQVTHKKLRGGKKIFLSTPIHHHFEAIGWPSYKVTMRYWIISLICGISGIIIALIF